MTPSFFEIYNFRSQLKKGCQVAASHSYLEPSRLALAAYKPTLTLHSHSPCSMRVAVRASCGLPDFQRAKPNVQIASFSKLSPPATCLGSPDRSYP
jgi:hypothetical protein